MLCERLDGRTRILLKNQGVYDIMSVSEPEACLHGYGERRMAVMIAAKQRQAPKVRIMIY